MSLRSRIADFIFGGPVRQKPLPAVLSLPIIFANGRDLDDMGLQAYCRNEPVSFRGETIIPPGPYRLTGTFRLAAHGAVIAYRGQVVGGFGCLCCQKPALVLDRSTMGDDRKLLFYGLYFDCEVVL
jgi:hypothetical protein